MTSLHVIYGLGPPKSKILATPMIVVHPNFVKFHRFIFAYSENFISPG